MKRFARVLYALPLLAMASCANVKSAVDSVTPDLATAGTGALGVLEGILKVILGLLPGFLQKLIGL